MRAWFNMDKIDPDEYIINEYGQWEETRCYLINGRERSLLIDTGLDAVTHIHGAHIGKHKYFKEVKKMKDRILETERLYLREMTQADFKALCKILQDEETMLAYEGAFSEREVQEWLDRQISRYHQWGFGLWAAVRKETNEMIGQCGLTMQPWKAEEVLEVGYLFQRRYWHRGYAIEAAKACKQYAFEILGAEEVCSIIRDTNTASRKVAERNGMAVTDEGIKHYRGVDMLHYRYTVRRL